MFKSRDTDDVLGSLFQDIRNDAFVALAFGSIGVFDCETAERSVPDLMSR